MLEQNLREGEGTGWLPTYEAHRGNGTLCQNDIRNAKFYGARYLPFAPNGINWIKHDGDIISYNFTGCIMSYFVYENIARVCHVATGESGSCHAEWKKIKSKSSQIIEFKPSDYIDINGQAGGFVGCYGLITRTRLLYSLTVVNSKDKGLIISSIKRAFPLNR